MGRTQPNVSVGNMFGILVIWWDFPRAALHSLIRPEREREGQERNTEWKN